jgi:D-beta-D-heptose 7-phosphate kinase/D-beta-D-heptose 1-phosphate adenosyltransferase
MFAAARVLVVGDVILDRYWYGSATRISPEAPVPVVRIDNIEDRPGGAGNVAVNVSGLGAQATLVGVTGVDEEADILVRQLEAHGIRCFFTRQAGFPTITKLRVLSRNQQLIRLDFEDQARGLKVPQLVKDYRKNLDATDVVVLSDYAKGSLDCISELIHLARAACKPVMVDPKGPDFSRYRRASLITPNLKEFEAVVGRCGSEEAIACQARALCDALELEALLITRGEHGITLIQRKGGIAHLPAHAAEVYDVTGAGDTVIATLATALAASHTLHGAAALANTAAGLVVGKLGATAVSVEELLAAPCQRRDYRSGIVDEETLTHNVQQARSRRETIVMTNGCFDILHAGHVRYLQEARALGDRLVVAVNDDGSVRRLKGVGRPINRLEDRMNLLDALAAVDWVVPFSEDTPQRLIGCVLPDVLVKGSDYELQEIAGGERVRANGGEVVIIDHVEGFSTSNTIAEIQRLSNARHL